MTPHPQHNMRNQFIIFRQEKALNKIEQQASNCSINDLKSHLLAC